MKKKKKQREREKGWDRGRDCFYAVNVHAPARHRCEEVEVDANVHARRTMISGLTILENLVLKIVNLK
jgi:hypothetical protein